MIRWHCLEHRFVTHLPERLEPGVLYISMEYGTAAHSCCCGCGEEVVTPFTPTDWKMTYDGESVSLRPSVGNWNLVCRSHYVIDSGRVFEAGRWSNSQIAAERRRDKAAKEGYYEVSQPIESPISEPVETTTKSETNNWWSRLHGRLFTPRRNRSQ